MKINARVKTYEVLKEIVIYRKYSNLVLRSSLDDVNDIDKKLITYIVYGSIQNYDYLLYQWSDLIKKKPSKEVEILLNMSIYQILFMDKLPEYAIVNEAVDIAKTIEYGKYYKMVNAILREVLRRKERLLEGSELEILAIKTSHPLWLLKMWSKQYGLDIMNRIVKDNNKQANSAARANTMKCSINDILANEKFTRGIIDNCVYYDGGNIANTEEFKKGLLTIQDEASQLVAVFMQPKENERILDTCGAPGTKTTHIAELMNDKGEIIALDIHQHRVELIKNSCKRLGIGSIDARCDDACSIDEQDYGLFDRILVDAPCSGYGVIRRKPDIKLHMNSNDMDEIIQLQKGILNNTCKLLKSGGILVYSTCTLNKKENELQIKNFIEENKEFILVEEKTIFPFELDSDGFYMAKLLKV